MKVAKSLNVLFLFVLSLLLTCNGNPSVNSSLAAGGPNRATAKPGGFQLLVHDAPPAGNIQAINVTVISVDLVSANGGILNVSDKTTTFNLLDFTAGNPLQLVNKVIPSGRYSQIRLKLSEEHTITVDGVVKPLKTPSAEQSGLKLNGYFEITEGLLYTMRLHFDPNKSIVYNPGPDRYILKPVIDIVGNSLVDGPFTVTGLVENEMVVSELLPNGTLRLLTTADPRLEFHGIYYYNYGTQILHLELSSVLCGTCSNVGAIPSTVLYNVPNTDIKIHTWDTTSIDGSVGSGLSTRAVSFRKTATFTLEASTGYTVLNVVMTYPANANGKFGVLSLVPENVAGRTFADIQQIQNQTATFVFKIPYSELPGGIPAGNKNFVATPITAVNITDLRIMATSIGSICGNIVLAATNYVLNVPVADKPLAANLTFVVPQ